MKTKMGKRMRSKSYNDVKYYYEENKNTMSLILKQEIQLWLQEIKYKNFIDSFKWTKSDIFSKARKFTIREGKYDLFKISRVIHKIPKFNEVIENVLRLHGIRIDHKLI